MLSRSETITIGGTRTQSQEMYAVNKEPHALCGSLSVRFTEGSGERWGYRNKQKPGLCMQY